MARAQADAFFAEQRRARDLTAAFDSIAAQIPELRGYRSCLTEDGRVITLKVIAETARIKDISSGRLISQHQCILALYFGNYYGESEHYSQYYTDQQFVELFEDSLSRWLSNNYPAILSAEADEREAERSVRKFYIVLFFALAGIGVAVAFLNAIL